MAESKTKKGVSLGDILAGVPDVSKSDTPKGPLVLAYADIDTIHPAPYNAKVFTLSDLAGLMDLIVLEGGLQQPLYVVQDGEGWEIKSGHRRHAALAALVKGSDKNPPHPELRLVPVVYRPDAAAADLERVTDVGELEPDKAQELARLMGELRILIGNMGNRKQTHAELSAAAQELESHYAALAELGVKFPGRLREQVAKACSTSETKLARLKVIREKLVEPLFVKKWEDGKLPEQGAYALARMPAMLQKAIAEQSADGVPLSWRLEDIQKKGASPYLSTDAKCQDGSGCTNGKNFLARDLDPKNYYGVGSCHCCVTCDRVVSCKYACPAGKEKAKKLRAPARAENKEARVTADRISTNKRKFWAGFATRLSAACGGKRSVCEKAMKELAASGLHEYHDVVRSDLLDIAFRGDESIYKSSGVSVCVLAAICRQLGVSADFLLGLAETPTAKPAAAPAASAPKPPDGKPTWMPGGSAAQV